MKCDRRACGNATSGDLLYCSERCYNLDNDPNPITVTRRNNARGFGGAFGGGIHWQERKPVILPENRTSDPWDTDYPQPADDVEGAA